LTLSREEFAALKAADALGEPDNGWVRADPNLPASDMAIVLSVRLPGDRLAELELAAEARGIAMSELARDWVLERLGQEGNPQRRHELLGAELARYQQEHGVFTEDELAQAQAQIDAAARDVR